MSARPHGRGGLTLACRLLPWSVRPDTLALYGVFRTLDDLVDGDSPDAGGRVAAVEGWARGGAADSPESRILAELADRHPLPRSALQGFCAGMRTDLDRRRIRTERELDFYCFQVAGTVGITLASVLGVRAPCDGAAGALGIALQRTNILRDIDEDLAAGRVYVARETVERFGSLRPGRRAALLRDQIARADRLYEQATPHVRLLRRGRLAVSVAATTYREILRQLEREGLGARPGRAVVSSPRKLAAITRV